MESKGPHRDRAHKQASFTGSSLHAAVTHSRKTCDGPDPSSHQENIPSSCICLQFDMFDSTTLVPSACHRLPEAEHAGRSTPVLTPRTDTDWTEFTNNMKSLSKEKIPRSPNQRLENSHINLDHNAKISLATRFVIIVEQTEGRSRLVS